MKRSAGLEAGTWRRSASGGSFSRRAITRPSACLPGSTGTLRVTIGAGEGHNWWCVVFPALCLPANAEDFEAVCEAAGFTEGEISALTEDSGEIEVEFKTLELLGKLKKILWDA